MKRSHGGDQDKKYLDFSININPFGTMTAINSIIKENIQLIDRYPDVYYEELKREISYNWTIPQECIILGNGANELIMPILFSLKEFEVLLATPMFEEFAHYGGFLDINLHYMNHFHIDNKTFILNVIQYFEAFPNIKAFLMVNPNNPTGKAFTKEELKPVIDYCESHLITFIIDESFMDFIEDRESYSLVNEFENYSSITILKSMTKMYGIPGLRLGLAFTKNQGILKSCQNLLQPWNLSLLSVMAMKVILKDKKYRSMTIDYIRKEKKRLEEALTEKGICFEDSKVNFLLIKGEVRFFNYLIANGIYIRDCSNFKGLPKNYYRIGIQNKLLQDNLIKVIQGYKEDIYENNTY